MSTQLLGTKGGRAEKEATGQATPEIMAVPTSPQQQKKGAADKGTS
jgi:hypothetical protein